MLEKNIQSLLNSGLDLFNKKEFNQAELIYKEILRLDKKNAEAYCALGTIAAIRSKYKDALNYLNITIKLQPQNFYAHNNIGTIFFSFEKFNEAIEHYTKSLIIKPDYLNSLYMRGLAYERKKNLTLAIKDYYKIKKFFPDDMFIDGVILLAKAKICSWNNYTYQLNKLIKKIKNKILAWEPLTSVILQNSLEIQKTTTELYVKEKSQKLKDIFIYKKNEGKIKIGYFSSDFYSHAVSLLISKVFELHNKDKFTFFGFSLFKPPFEDKTYEKIKGYFNQFIEMENMTDGEIINIIRSHKIDIAIDLNGFTSRNRFNIFFNRIAPIQVNYLGYPGTMGFENMDYIIADKIIIPESHKIFYKEKIIFMPDTYQATDNTRKISDRIFTKDELGLPEKNFIYGCFNSSFKITPEIFKIWINILKKVKDSTLWLLFSNNEVVNNLKKELTKNSISEDRLVFAEGMENSLHLARLKKADLILDTLPYNGHTTTSDALWAGVPVLTCIGETFAGRVSASLLHACNMQELITNNLQEYEDLAVNLAIDKMKINKFKNHLSSKKSLNLFNSELFTKNLEKAYETIYHNHNLGISKKDIYIN
jgi:predicted O-linked N-acetylglucosamine transferase (SPINDLY family)